MLDLEATIVKWVSVEHSSFRFECNEIFGVDVVWLLFFSVTAAACRLSRYLKIWWNHQDALNLMWNNKCNECSKHLIKSEQIKF